MVGKLLAIQIAAIIIFAGGLTAILTTTDIYEQIQENIVEVLCLSCLKLDSKTSFSYTTELATDGPLPDFLTKDLATGPIFLHYSQDVCHGCEEMLPVIQHFTDLTYGKYDTVIENLTIDGSLIHYYYINNDHAPEYLAETFALFDIQGIGARPMFVLLTYDSDASGHVQMVYGSQSGVLGGSSYQDRYAYVETIIDQSIEMWDLHHTS